MTREQIIEIANKVKLPHEYANGEPMWLDKLEAFAKLVAEKEREACANICETLELPEWPDKVRQPLAKAIRSRGQE